MVAFVFLGTIDAQSEFRHHPVVGFVKGDRLPIHCGRKLQFADGKCHRVVTRQQVAARGDLVGTGFQSWVDVKVLGPGEALEKVVEAHRHGEACLVFAQHEVVRSFRLQRHATFLIQLRFINVRVAHCRIDTGHHIAQGVAPCLQLDLVGFQSIALFIHHANAEEAVVDEGQRLAPGVFLQGIGTRHLLVGGIESGARGVQGVDLPGQFGGQFIQLVDEVQHRAITQGDRLHQFARSQEAGEVPFQALGVHPL